MKSIILVLLFVTAAYAEPFLVCDVPPVDQQILRLDSYQDGVLINSVTPPWVIHPNGSVVLFDLVGVTPGQYSFTATAINAWGASSLSNPFVSPTSAAPPLNINMSP